MSDTHPIEALNALKDEALEAIASASDARALEGVRVTYLGRKEGRISGILRGLGALSAEERPAVGQLANQVKAAVTEAIDVREAAISIYRDLPSPAASISASPTSTAGAIWR